ncbi:Fimbrial protein [Shewanella sp. MR-4]|uniref:fimbrial protein n=1 Tax=Shewanella sp. (strain MR-4) TaxID=60480 RepID=UPI0000DE1C76|nr:fimbrial protein [Shewanella sp. MR-4]ABI39309.1 Fimbrial protein [Shewanella sp. MR-4]
MNKKIISLAIACLPVIVVPTAKASTGTITFNGEVTSSTCTVKVNGTSADAVVTLPTVSTSDLAADTVVAGRTTFTINLSECTLDANQSQVVAFFESGTNVVATTGRLKNNGTAGNVSLQLLDAVNSSVIKAGDEGQKTSNTATTVAGDGTAILPYAVEYYAEGAAATAGTVTSSVTYSIHYM